MELLTPWGENLPEIPWDTYPRPQMRRDSFLCLNGLWDFSENDQSFSEKIRVPFAPESTLSGINRRIDPKAHLFYRRKFALPEGFVRDKVLLHIGATDQIAKVTVNGVSLGMHTGGYLPFEFDITDVLQAENELVIETYNADDLLSLPYGKQCEKRGGMWYTPTSGIWQSVWLESVPETYIKGLKITTSGSRVRIEIDGADHGEVDLCTPQGGRMSWFENGVFEYTVQNPVYWSPQQPYLYEFTLRAGEDTVHSYFALRDLSIETVGGLPRLCLNGKPVFFHGLLDQGYFSDGILTPAKPEAYDEEAAALKKLGFNTLRKHIKIEPEQFYYACDRLGLFVFQDMVNCGKYNFLRDTALPTVGFKRKGDRFAHRDKATRANFEKSMIDTVAHLNNHPCIVYWTIFNEGWGQFDSAKMYDKLKALDPTRFIDSASGWFYPKKSDVESPHVYFKKIKIKPANKPVVLSEFGGYACAVQGHLYNTEKSYGYRQIESCEALEAALSDLYEKQIVPNIKNGLCGAIYTQVSDVEDEINGLFTYDRRVRKVGMTAMKKIAQTLFDAFSKTVQ